MKDKEDAIEAAVAELADRWRSSGLGDGDLVLLHSDITGVVREFRTRKVRLRSADILESFLRCLGANGTLLLPLFNFGFAEGQPFDMRSTTSRMGALTEAGRAHSGAVRTGHPIYSFAAIGKLAEEFRGVTNDSGYDKDSPFGILHRHGGKIAVLDLPSDQSMTFIHYVEQCEQVPYRFHKRFEGNYTDEDGNTSLRTFGLFVRRLDQGVVTDTERMDQLLWDSGIWQGDRPRQQTRLRTGLATEIYDAITGVIRSGNALGMLYRIEKPEATENGEQ